MCWVRESIRILRAAAADRNHLKNQESKTMRSSAELGRFKLQKTSRKHGRKKADLTPNSIPNPVARVRPRQEETGD